MGSDVPRASIFLRKSRRCSHGGGAHEILREFKSSAFASAQALHPIPARTARRIGKKIDFPYLREADTRWGCLQKDGPCLDSREVSGADSPAEESAGGDWDGF